MFALVFVALCGQYRQQSCLTAPLYRQQVTYGYQQQSYQQYQQPLAYTDGVAYQVYQPAYSVVVGGQQRQQARYAEQATADTSLAAQVAALTAELGRLRTQIASPGTPAPPTPAIPDTSVPPPPVPAGQPSELAKAAQAIFSAKCGKCHTGASKSGNGFTILDDSGVLAAILPLNKLKIDQKCYSGEMPPDPRQALTREEYSAIRAYINEDKDAIEAAIALCLEKTQ